MQSIMKFLVFLSTKVLDKSRPTGGIAEFFGGGFSKNF